MQTQPNTRLGLNYSPQGVRVMVGIGLGLGFTAGDRRLGLFSRHQVGVRVRVSSNRQGALIQSPGALRLPRNLCACA